MGMFDDITGKAQELLGQTGGKTGIMKGIMEMLSDKGGGGLGGIIQSFQQKGMGNIISSWIGTGRNEPITPDQVKDGLGQERVEQVAQHAGVSSDEAAAQLSEHLPNVVDKLTPEGKVPEGGMLDKGVDFLKSKLS